MVHDGDAVLSSAMFQRRGLVYLGNLIHLSNTHCASAKVTGSGSDLDTLPSPLGQDAGVSHMCSVPQKAICIASVAWSTPLLRRMLVLKLSR